MRRVLVDYARARASASKAELLDLDLSLEALSRDDESLARIIEMKYLGGMTAEEIARALSRSPHVVRHDLRFAEAWLRRKPNR